MEEKPKHPGSENLIPMKKGETRNPKGRPKGTENWSTLFKRLSKIIPKLDRDTSKFFGLDGLPPEIKKDARTLKQILALKVFQKASAGDLKALEMIMERMDGKPAQFITQVDLSPQPLFSDEDPNAPFGFVPPVQLGDCVATEITEEETEDLPPAIAPQAIEAPPPPVALAPQAPESQEAPRPKKPKKIKSFGRRG